MFEAHLLEPAPPWMKLAACRRHPYSWWYLGPEGETATPAETEKALRICRTSCPVLRDCIQQAHTWTKQGRRPLGVVLAGVKWGTPKDPTVVPSFRPCVCCGGTIPPWVREGKTHCERCVKRGVRVR